MTHAERLVEIITANEKAESVEEVRHNLETLLLALLQKESGRSQA